VGQTGEDHVDDVAVVGAELADADEARHRGVIVACRGGGVHRFFLLVSGANPGD